MSLEIHHADRIPKDFAIFFCWQSQLPRKFHRQLIQSALSNAINRVQNQLPEELNCVIRMDSDTNGRAGAVDIANTILSKIASSTMIVADVTPVFHDEANNVFYPNSNVMFEVGYGAKSLGWNRIICAFNARRNGSGSKLRPEDMPFDIRHRRLNPYICTANSGVAQASGQLEASLAAGILAVIQEIDRGEFSPLLEGEALKRGKDIRLLKTLLNQVHGPSLDQYIESGSRDQLYDICDFFWYGFEAVVCSSHFRFYDKNLDRLATEMWAVWRKCVVLSGQVFGPNSHPGNLSLKGHHLWNEAYEVEVNEWRQAVQALPNVFKALLEYVHNNYPEIDLDETNENAWRSNLPYIGEPM